MYSFIERAVVSYAMLLQPVVASISYDGQQPCPPVIASKSCLVPERLEVSLLHRVFSIVLVSHQPTGQIIGRVQVGQEPCHLIRRRFQQEAVTQPMHCKNMPGRARVWLQLLAEPDYVRVHGTRVRIGLETPNGVQDRVPRERTVRIQ